jgi:putative ABC transport system permease protein
LHPLKFTLRQLARAPGYTAISVLIVAIGVGAVTAIFSALNAVVLRPLALPDPDQLVAVYESNLSHHLPTFEVSLPNYLDWRDRSRSWQSLAALHWVSMLLTGTGEPELFSSRAITANFLPTFGIAPMLGRNFLDEEDRPGGPLVAIVSEQFWRTRLDSQPDVVGRTILFNKKPYTIVGVIPANVILPSGGDILVPMAADATHADRLNHTLQVYGRLKPGVTLEQASAEMKTVAAQIWTEFPQLERGWSNHLVPFNQWVVHDKVRTALAVLFAAVAVLLLIACANLSNLMLVRASGRAHELAVRAALGAGRSHLIRQLVGEAALIATAGGSLGLLLALWTVEALRAAPLPRANEISIDHRVLCMALAVTFLTALLASVGPALRASAAKPQDALKSRSARVTHRSRFRDTMVIAQIALSLTLLVGAALLGRSFLKLLQVDPGFRTEKVLTFGLRPSVYDQHAAAFYDDVLARVQALPDVAAAGTVSSLPLTDDVTSLNVFPLGHAAIPAGQSIQSEWRLVDGDYFGAVKIPLLRGKTFAGFNADEGRRSVILSASLAHELFGDADPIGREIRPGFNNFTLTVIGVVGDVRSHRLGQAPSPTFYWSLHRTTSGTQWLAVRTRGEIAPLITAVRQTVKSIDPAAPLYHVRTLADRRDASLDQERLLLGLLGGFALVALLLAALGTYGVIAFMVQQRTHEIGIRLAIGAGARDVLRLVLREGARLIVIGGALGVLGAFAAARMLASTLYATPTSDSASYLLALSALTIVAFAAVLLPARRATKVDPIIALRSE